MPSLDHLQFILEEFFILLSKFGYKIFRLKDIPVLSAVIRLKPSQNSQKWNGVARTLKNCLFATKHTADQVLTVAPD